MSLRPPHILGTIALTLCGCAICGDASYRDLKLQDLLGASWPEFAAELDSLLANPRNEDAFYRMYKIAQRSDAESKVPQFLLKLNREHPEKEQIQTLLGLFYRENRDHAQAAKYFRGALKNHPDDYFAHYQLAHLLSKQDGGTALKEALEHYRQAADRVGESDLDLKTRTLEEWGQLLFDAKGGDADARAASRNLAAQVWDRLIADERKFDKLTYERLAQIYQRNEMWEKAIATERLYLANAAGDDVAARVRVLDETGGLAEKLNDFGGASAAYSEALALVDENHWLHKQLVVKLVKVHKRAGDDAAFAESLRKAAQEQPQSVVALRDLALAFENGAGSAAAREAAIQTLERAAALAPRDVSIVSDLLLLYSNAGKEALAKKAGKYRALIKIMPENFDAYAGLADTYWEMGDTAKVQEALSLLQNTASVLPEKFRVMANAYRKFGMKASARNAYERALAGAGADGVSADLLMEFCDFCLACAEAERGDGDSLARAHELRGAMMAPGVLDESGYLRLMDVFQQHGRGDDARDIIGYAATNVFPKSFVCRRALADLHYARKEFYKAIQHYVAALELTPNFYFKRLVNDRIATLTWNYGRRQKDFISEPSDAEKKQKMLGGANGEGLAPWIYYLQARVANDPQNADTMMLLAQLNESTQADAAVGDARVKTDAGRAKALYKSVVDMDLKNLDAHAALARTLVATDEFEGAIQENWILEELGPAGKWQYAMNAGDLWALAGYREKALQNWNTVSEQATTEPNLVYQLGCRMFQAGKLDEAAALVRKAASANRNEFRLHATLGNLLDLAASKDGKDGAAEEAVREFSTAVELAGQNAALGANVQPVMRRLFEAEVRLARTNFLHKKFGECERVCSDALATMGKLSGEANGEMKAELDCLRARAMCAGERKAQGEELLRATLAGHPATAFWVDDALRMTGAQLLRVYESKGNTKTNATKTVDSPAVSLDRLCVVPGKIGAAHAGRAGALYLECAGAIYRVSRESAELKKLNLIDRGNWTAWTWWTKWTRNAAIHAAWRASLSRSGLWRGPIVAGDTVLMIDEMSNTLFAFESFGGLKFQRTLGAAVLCDPVAAGQDRVMLYSLSERRVRIQCLDTVTGQIGWETPLAYGADAMRGVQLDPISWNGWLLHFDAAAFRIWAVRLESGEAAASIELKAICDAKMFEGVVSWGVAGGELFLAARSGHVAWVRLAN